MSVKVHRGQNYRQLNFDDFPLEVVVNEGEGDEKTFRAKYEHVRISASDGDPFKIEAVDYFFGHDHGDVYEMDVHLYADGDRFVSRRIEEDIAPSNRPENWKDTMTHLLVASELTIYVTCRVTGSSRIGNAQHPSYNKWRGVFDLNIILIGS